MLLTETSYLSLLNGKWFLKPAGLKMNGHRNINTGTALLLEAIIK